MYNIVARIPKVDKPIIFNNAESTLINEYKIIIEKLKLSKLNNQIKSITVISENEKEGKSTTCFNLAYMLSQAGIKVLIIDADILGQSIHKIIGIQNQIGLTEALVYQTPLDKLIQNTSISNLQVLSAGTLELIHTIDAVNFKLILEICKSKYDLIIVDSPPISLFPENATIILKEIDSALILIQDYDHFKSSIRWKRFIEKIGNKFLGVILNKIENTISNLCNICGNKNDFKSYKPCRSNNKVIFRNKMYCEKCDSQERHRFMWEYIKKNQHIIKNKQVVHCGSEFCLFKPISKLTKTYNKIDINPRPDQIQMDILNMVFESESIDTFICSHVLEHIKDDNKAMKEVARILKKDGIAILLVPINGRENTTEFLTPNKEDFDHYRNYGYIDFIDKLKLYFTSVKRILPQDILDERVIDLCSLSYEKDQGIFECKK